MLEKNITMDSNIDNNFNISEDLLEDIDEYSMGGLLGDCKNVPINVAKLIIWLIDNHPHALIEELLTRGFPWPKDIPFENNVFIPQDDTDGNISGFWLGVSKDNDKWLQFEMQEFDEKKRLAMSHSLRFRNGDVGGTSNPRMNPALHILLLACLKDKRSKDGYIIDPETGRPLGWGEMRDLEREEDPQES